MCPWPADAVSVGHGVVVHAEQRKEEHACHGTGLLVVEAVGFADAEDGLRYAPRRRDGRRIAERRGAGCGPLEQFENARPVVGRIAAHQGEQAAFTLRDAVVRCCMRAKIDRTVIEVGGPGL